MSEVVEALLSGLLVSMGLCLIALGGLIAIPRDDMIKAFLGVIVSLAGGAVICVGLLTG